jgi:hypothetical protein
MPKMRLRPYYDDTDDDAFDDSGVLKDGRSYKVPVRFMDSVSRSVRKRFARIHDGNGDSGAAALQRPGFRVADAFARDEAKVAYQQYEAAIQSEWRNIRPADFGGPGIGPNQNTCNQDKPESYLLEFDTDADQRVKGFDRRRDGTTGREPRRQSSDVATLLHDHQQRMATLYAEREREMQEEWRCGK